MAVPHVACRKRPDAALDMTAKASRRGSLEATSPYQPLSQASLGQSLLKDSSSIELSSTTRRLLTEQPGSSNRSTGTEDGTNQDQWAHLPYWRQYDTEANTPHLRGSTSLSE